MNTFVTGLIVACIIGSILLAIAVVIFGGLEAISSRFPKAVDFFVNMFNDGSQEG